jgi:hypothetical protein
MKRRFFALLAVPALAMGFALASPGTDEAHAWLHHSTVCAIAKSQIAIAQAGGDEGSAGAFYANAKDYGCDPWSLI